MKPVDKSSLARWRTIDAATCLVALADFAKVDPSFAPRKDMHSTRWHANANGQDFELLCTGPKFWDTRALRGGGGAVDLAMHLFGVDFKQAIAMLVAKSI